MARSTQERILNRKFPVDLQKEEAKHSDEGDLPWNWCMNDVVD
jgi:hypothetical protein